MQNATPKRQRDYRNEKYRQYRREYYRKHRDIDLTYMLERDRAKRRGLPMPTRTEIRERLYGPDGDVGNTKWDELNRLEEQWMIDNGIHEDIMNRDEGVSRLR